MSPEKRAENVVNGRSMGALLFEAEEDIATAVRGAVAAERERCCDVVARFFMDPLPDRHMSLRDVVVMLGRIMEMIQTGGKS